MPLFRIIPCLDLAAGRVVKGVRFQDLRDAGDAVELAQRYEQSGADELVFLDITATVEGRQATLETVRAVAAELTIPFTVGGGIRSVEDARLLLKAGCDKISINSAAVRDPAILHAASHEFGSQCVVLAIDAVRTANGSFEVAIDSGKVRTGIDPVRWAAEAVERGAGELLVTSIDRDGTKDGFDLQLLQAIRQAVNVPIIASGGAGKLEHFAEAFTYGIDAALAASLFHYDELRIEDVKTFLARHGIAVRPLSPNTVFQTSLLEELRWGEDGLLPVVIQDARTGKVLTLAHANREALEETLRAKTTVLFSRSRQALWRKGETSGNTQRVESVHYDCDADALLYRVTPSGPACHTGENTCFHNTLMTASDEDTATQSAGNSGMTAPNSSNQTGAFIEAITHLQNVLAERKTASPEDSYVARLYAKGVDSICKKIGEEAGEVIIAAKNGAKGEIVWEAGDLIFHLLVLLSHLNVTLDEVGAELLSRR